MWVRCARSLWAAAFFVCASGVAAASAPDFGTEPASDEARYAAAWVMAGADHGGRPFAIVDKREARLYVFAPDGRLLGASPALLGLTPGDDAVPDSIGLDPARLTPAQRTTPAGRFASQPGHNDKGEGIVWVDYAASLAIHRLRPAPPQERRPARLASASADDKRISRGCVIVPGEFYDAVVAASLGRQRGVVYVLPESRPAQTLLGGIELGLR